MNLNFNELLSDRLSDKEIYHLADFLMEMALAFESRYYTQIRRYLRAKERKERSEQYIKNNEVPF